ncbi:bifunctional peptidase and (3S)-lysyl hydroxylase Jmjd7 [Oryza brachyantha]|uniref:bifunctional peptidase and (3S)-lysyl hydroxylase Jmjd7 n=1 Tax=Oryza brachyantha TaxID=4533 RepID=UPI001ADD2198|nr:bifunctional peptidase and (3S)-lysyl hydroxylase Jmjd7 [Oryza brachyantha]XP_040383309.1 bifunctional peptidase and (3S)-lysyl hydroxylase Jmjd7 [Oryza brachyantha]XP_040383310.1 bifunctional peptidase and (3S)-lysyl hydroxylase Jmjd7 [Oryza brachyantha]XP_040383311.1 bifunctional peptidase and (3S)-lysyl hydroxylase Jmjd7 [Oryza brachyantha]
MERAVRELWAESRDLLGLHSPDAAAVPRAEMPPTPLAFLRDHVSPGRPLLVSSAATRHWPAASLWPTESYLADALRSTAVSLHLTPDGRADALAPHPRCASAKCFASAHVRQVDFPAAVRLIRSSDPGSGLVAYAQQQDDCLRGEYAAVAGDVDAHVPWASEALGCLPEAVNLWIGSACSQTSFHKDHYDNIYVVVSGEKHFLLLPPTEHHRLYVRDYPAARYVAEPEGEGDPTLKLELEEPERIVPWSSVDPYPPSPEETAAQVSSFPLYFEGPRPIHCTVRAGEMLYLPSMWFHHVSQSPGPNGLTIAVNYWYDMQFDIKYAYFNFLRSFEINGSKRIDAPEGDLEETTD